ncbi:MAG: hypothetical protein LBP87_11580 [Planctomycetaceae bacterium]|jgi:hypothetical protein|nr:hypothetical protein [Planctomycetaceae bacterium]
MTNNNLANISTFENIQNQANKSMSISSSLSVFNATFRVEDKKKAKEFARQIERWKENFIEEEQYLIRTKPELEQLKKAAPSARKYLVDYNNLRVKRIGSRGNLTQAIKDFKRWGITATSTELQDDD